MSENTIPQPEQQSRPRTGRLIVIIAVFGVICLVVIVIMLRLGQIFSSQPREGLAPDFTLETYPGYDGNTYTLSDLRGQVVVINFWASWCAPCAEEADDLEAAW